MTGIQVYESIKQKVVSISQSLRFDKFVNKVGRKLALSIEDAIALALFKQKQSIETKKSIYEIFNPPCSYKTLVVSLNRWAKLALVVLALLLKFNHKHQHLIKHTDSTDIPVCRNKNARYHKTMKHWSAWSHNGQDHYYGLKLHLTSDLNRNILAVRFTSANMDDRKVCLSLNRDLMGIFVADSGYVSAELEKNFYVEGQRMILVKPKKNQKKLATAFDTWVYGTRMLIEINFRSLKLFYGLITSLPRSVAGYLANYTYSLLAYLLA